jgi:hypothetical protein
MNLLNQRLVVRRRPSVVLLTASRFLRKLQDLHPEGEGERILPTDGLRIKIKIGYEYLLRFLENITVFWKKLDKK